MSRFAEKRKSQASKPQALTAPTPQIRQAYTNLLRIQRTIAGMLVACAILGLTVFRVPPRPIGSRALLAVILSTSVLTFAFTMRNFALLPALADLRRNPHDASALKRWQRNTLIVLSLCAVVGLTGFALQLFGIPLAIPLTLYVTAIAYLFLLRPIQP